MFEKSDDSFSFNMERGGIMTKRETKDFIIILLLFIVIIKLLFI